MAVKSTHYHDRTDDEIRPEKETEITKRRVGKLIGEQRRQLSDDCITDFSEINDDGHKVKTLTKRDAEGKEHEVEIDLTTLLHPTPSITTNVEILLTEARIIDEADEDEAVIKNPHVPAHDGVLESAEDRLEEEGLTPAWKVIA